jgi:predicted MFS family arabinose efflux permease
MTPWLLLTFTFILGLGAALNAPAWRSITPDIVSKENLSKAIVLNGLGVNGSRIIGPALGGFIIAALGTNWVFILNAVSFIGVIFVLYSWKNKSVSSELPAESLFDAIIKGLKYVRNSKIMESTLTHASAFFPFSSAMFALLPLFVRQQLGLNSGGYGIMLGFLGLGAVTGAVLLPRIQLRLSLHQTVMYGQMSMVLLLLLLGLSQNQYIAYCGMFIGGLGWIAVLSNLQTVVLNYVPGWVRSRVMSVYLLTFFAAQSIGSFLWGIIATHTSIPVAFMIAAGGLLITAFLTWNKELPSGKPIDFSPTIFAPVQSFAEQPGYEDGPLIISAEYIITPERLDAFKEHMERVRRARLRAGAYSWYLAKDLNRPERQVEVFMVNSWLEYLRQRERNTAFDKKLQREADAFHTGENPPVINYYLSELG